MNVLEFGNLSSAWRGINEYLFLECEDVVSKGGGLYGPEWVSYDNYVKIKKCWVDPDFNFGKILGYTKKKWSALVKNYVDFKYLDLLRNEMNHRIKRNARSYNFSFHFSNHNGSGKDCLISLLFTKRLGISHPVVVFHVRTSEVTKRLIFDFLLVQRIVEYIYGHNEVEVHFFAPSFYITAESFLMYSNQKPLHKLLDKHKEKHNKEYHTENHDFQNRVLRVFDEFYNHPDPMKIRYKVHRRSARQIQKGPDGNPLSGVKDLLASQLLLNREILEKPKGVISRSQIRNYHKALPK